MNFKMSAATSVATLATAWLNRRTVCHFHQAVASLATAVMVVLLANQASAQMHVRDVCRLKGQEENTLTSLGLVVGLNGTGDGNSAPTQRALAAMLNNHGSPLGAATVGFDLSELKNAKNVALVWVTATVPAHGARQGDVIDCKVNANSASSLSGGMLLPTPLLGAPGDKRVYALAQGLLHLDDPQKAPVSANIHKGCRLEADFFNQYLSENGVFTLVLNRSHAGFEIVQEITEQINTQASTQALHHSDRDVARAVGPVNIEVLVPDAYQKDPVAFIAQILEMRIFNPETKSKVIINERAKTIVIGENVEVSPVVLSHKNLVIEPPSGVGAARFVDLNTSNLPASRLKDLVDALNEIRLPTEDIITIIKTLEQSGRLHGEVVVQ